MKKTLVSATLAAQLLTQLHAGGDIAPVELNAPEIVESEAVEAAESSFYIVVKGMAILGDTVNHEEAVLDGNKDYGYGIDLGYRLGSGFAVEYDFSYSSNTVTETRGNSVEEATGKYYTSALDLVYTYEVSENVGLFGKVGYEYEWEKIDAYHIDGRNNDFVFGAGVEIAMNETYKFVAEYEHSLIKGPRGDGILAGVMINF